MPQVSHCIISLKYLLSHLFIHSHSVNIPIHLGARDGHDASHCAECLLVHVRIHILETHLHIVLRNLHVSSI